MKKVKYVGTQGSVFPQIKEFQCPEMKRNEEVELPDAVADKLIGTPNFKLSTKKRKEKVDVTTDR